MLGGTYSNNMNAPDISGDDGSWILYAVCLSWSWRWVWAPGGRGRHRLGCHLFHCPLSAEEGFPQLLLPVCGVWPQVFKGLGLQVCSPWQCDGLTSVQKGPRQLFLSSLSWNSLPLRGAELFEAKVKKQVAARLEEEKKSVETLKKQWDAHSKTTNHWTKATVTPPLLDLKTAGGKRLPSSCRMEKIKSKQRSGPAAQRADLPAGQVPLGNIKIFHNKDTYIKIFSLYLIQ